MVHESEPRSTVRVGRYLDATALPSDTVFVVYGSAETLLYADLPSDHPYLWSLPMRVLDPELEALLTRLEGPDPPTWIVQWIPFNSWEIDSGGELREVVERRYRLVGEPCGASLDPLLARIGDVRVVCLGEASHGTHEFYACGSG